jgi:hypothetical protein
MGVEGGQRARRKASTRRRTAENVQSTTVARMIGGIVRDEREIVNDKYTTEAVRRDA